MVKDNAAVIRIIHSMGMILMKKRMRVFNIIDKKRNKMIKLRKIEQIYIDNIL